MVDAIRLNLVTYLVDFMIYCTKLNTWNKFHYMKSIFFLVLFALILFPVGSSFSQKTDTPSQFGIALTSTAPYNYKDSNGHTVIIGEIQNLKNFPITGVKIWGGFYNEIGDQPLETSIGTTMLDVIPAFGKSPYMIKSPNANAAISSVSVNLLGFTSATPKNQNLVISSETSEIGEKIRISGTITTNSGVDATNVKVHLAFYDAFQPPRILGISTVEIPSAITSGSSAKFEFNEKLDSRSLGYKVFAESSNHLSNVQNVVIRHSEVLTTLVTINDISINDEEGNKTSDVTAGSKIMVQSELSAQYSDPKKSEQQYRYYIQVKQSGEEARVEFIGIYEGSLSGTGSQFPSVEWVPEKAGLYFIETFVWDQNAVPLAAKGPVILVLVT